MKSPGYWIIKINEQGFPWLLRMETGAASKAHSNSFIRLKNNYTNWMIHLIRSLKL
jgi:hypothetical protein